MLAVSALCRDPFILNMLGIEFFLGTPSLILFPHFVRAKLRHAIRSELEGALTRLREQQVTQEEAELERKRAQRAAALRLKQKRDKSIKTQIRKDRNPMGL